MIDLIEALREEAMTLADNAADELERKDAALATANERIRGLEEQRDAMAECIADRDNRIHQLHTTRAAEREVSDKLVAALGTCLRRAKPHPDDNDADRVRNLYHIEANARAALSEVAAIRAKQGGEG